MDPETRQHAIGAVTSRLKFPQLLAIAAVLLLIDIVVPDIVPFVDEILLAMLTALFALWREPVPPPLVKPPEKNITPPRPPARLAG